MSGIEAEPTDEHGDGCLRPEQQLSRNGLKVVRTQDEAMTQGEMQLKM